ncbi:hypothetical protein QTG54_010361, partial [Skeletonema marinoi]
FLLCAWALGCLFAVAVVDTLYPQAGLSPLIFKNKRYGDMESRDNNYYDVRAQDVKLEDITSSAHNAEILRGLR